jgi:hypothetical protein
MRQKFNDFIETAYETFSGATVGESKTVKWTREEVDELVIGQVSLLNKYSTNYAN